MEKTKSSALKHDPSMIHNTSGFLKTPIKDEEASLTMLTPSPTTPIRSSASKLFSSNIKSATSEKSQSSNSNTEEFNDEEEGEGFNHQMSCVNSGHRNSIATSCASTTSDDSNDFSDSLNSNYYMGANKNNIITMCSGNKSTKMKTFNEDSKNDPNQQQQPESPKSPKSAFELRYGVKIVGIGEPDKPPYSYAAMIGLAILSSEEKRLTLSEIYDWISDNFIYYQRSDVGWHNSIRHNLSLNKAFSKTDKSEGKKGHYWQIEPGMESAFLKKKSRKSNTSSSANDTNNTNISVKKNIFKTNKIQSLKLKNNNNKQSNSEKNDSALPKVYQELTPHSSMIQDDDSELKSFANTDLLSKINENSIQKTPKKQIFRIKPNRQEFPEGNKRAFDDSDIDSDFDDNVEVGDVVVDKFLNKPTGIYNKRQKPSTPGFSFKNNIMIDENNNDSNISSLYNEEYSYWNKKNIGNEPSNLPIINIRDSNIFEDSGELVIHHPLASSFNSNFELSPVKNLTLNNNMFDSLETKSNNGNLKNTTGINSNTNINHLNSTPGTASAGSMSSILKQNPNNTNTSSASVTSATNIYINYSNSITAHSTANNTPNRIVRTPNSTNRRKIWNTPSYLDDFYTSPSNIKNRLEINKNGQHTPDTSGSPFNSSKKRINSPYRSLESNIMGNISTSYNDFFGVDICSVVKRAVKSVVDEKKVKNSVKE